MQFFLKNKMLKKLLINSIEKIFGKVKETYLLQFNVLLFLLIFSCGKKYDNIYIINSNFEKRHEQDLLQVKQDLSIVTEKKPKKEFNKVDVTNKQEFLEMTPDNILGEANNYQETYFPFVESPNYNGYIANFNEASDNAVLQNNKSSNGKNPFEISYNNIIYGPFVKKNNEFDNISVNNLHNNSNSSKLYPKIKPEMLENNINYINNRKKTNDMIENLNSDLPNQPQLMNE